MATTLDTHLRDVVGVPMSKTLAKNLDVHTIRDLLQHYPRRFTERGELTDLARLRVDDDVTVMATVETVSTKTVRGRKLTIVEAVVTDGRSRLGLTFFNQIWRSKELQPGAAGLFAGKVKEFRNRRTLNNPSYVLFDRADQDGDQLDDFAGALIPLYPATGGLQSWKIARCVKVALDALPPVTDPLPDELLIGYQLGRYDPSLRAIHRPDSRADYARARRRLAFDEALGVQLTLAQRRHAAAVNPAFRRPRRVGGLADAFDARLPFSLTEGQQRVGAELSHDLDWDHPMHRLLQGEVGSGKTVVALRAMLQVIDAGAQTALLAPTEVLAAQHARSIEAMLGDLADAGRFGAHDAATRVALLTGSLPAAARRRALLDAASGGAGIVIGTHALIQKSVEFADLGMVVVDEQHRFGVEQRDALRAKSAAPPHLLVMTATPIPRTVAMTVFGDLDVSTLDELPAGRSPISTSVVPAAEKPAWVERAWRRVAEEVEAGHQVYVVCPRIGDGSDLSSAGGGAGDDEAGEFLAGDDEPRPTRSVVETVEQLRTGPLAGLRIEALHGRLPAEEKDLVMRRFAAGEIDVLVATTVIEVGVDVANATVMVVLDAERFGVSQLHQLRGRVGRGSAPGLCLLLTESPADSEQRRRVDAVAATLDGFELARLDLEQRREGDILGAAQSGNRRTLRLLSLLRDEDLIVEAREAALALVADDPDLTHHPELARVVADLAAEDRAEYLEKA